MTVNPFLRFGRGIHRCSNLQHALWLRETPALSFGIVSNRSYFTNAKNIQRDDPYAQLGLQWGDGATTAEIKQAFRERAAKLHPDVNKSDSPDVAQKKFQDLQRAYQALMQTNVNTENESNEEWRFGVWNRGDRIACNRTDVAGVARERPAPPAAREGDSANARFAGMQLGHPSGRGVVGREEYLGDGRSEPTPSSVGRGQSKWVTPKPYQPWNASGH